MPLPESIRKRITERAERERAETAEDEPLFLHVRYRPSILRNAALIRKLDTFSAKSGFARNLSFTSVLVGIAFVAFARLRRDWHLLWWG